MKKNNDDNDEKKGEFDFELIKENSSKIVINKNNKKVDSFEILSKDKEFCYESEFIDLSFRYIYENNPLFKHVIFHINELLEKNKNSKDKEIIKILSNFINNDEFSEEIIEKILLNGIPESLPCLRPLIWKSLIGFFPLKQLSKWVDITNKKKSDYQKMIDKYNYYPNNLIEPGDKYLLDQISKDIPRTRFDVPFFKEKNNDKEINYDIIKRILFFYSKEHKEVNYIQGMNEIIAIIFYIFSKDDNPFSKDFIESDAYFTFEKLMSEIKDIFLLDDINYSELFVTFQIKEIKHILKKIDLELLNYFKKIGLEIDNFVMRWILVLFAQEFTIDVAVNFWDRLFTQKNKLKFICYISVAIIKNNRENIMKMDAGEVMLWAQQLQKKMKEIDISNIVKMALQIQNSYKKKESNNIEIK